MPQIQSERQITCSLHGFREELVETCQEEREKLELLEVQMAEVDKRLGKLYDALETGEFKGGELAPRIKALFEKKEELQQSKVEAEEALCHHIIELADPLVVRAYVQDLRGLLGESCIVEQKAFLKSFVEGIEVGESEVKVKYTVPMLPDRLATEVLRVLPFIQNGSPNTTFTESLCSLSWLQCPTSSDLAYKLVTMNPTLWRITSSRATPPWPPGLARFFQGNRRLIGQEVELSLPRLAPLCRR